MMCAGHAMLSSETVRKIGFTGSTAVGKMLAEQAAKVRLESQAPGHCLGNP
jgi:acyl-CoA reductase-like NAD-dependent aldehyde dehydrogenase